ncbi:MAG: DUF4129 domain-containing protein [Nitrososphaeria archaeon]|nr:DUF4129 domain-containing protein [Nitrososphaeria archaeon]
MNAISPEAQFWIILNAILLALIIMLVSRLVRRRIKRSETSISALQTYWISTFEQLMMTEASPTAIIAVFNQVLKDLKDYLGLSLKIGLTPRETLLAISSKLPEEIGLKLLKLYDIYEPIRFGGRAAGREDLEEFRKILISLADEVLSWRGMEPDRSNFHGHCYNAHNDT